LSDKKEMIKMKRQIRNPLTTLHFLSLLTFGLLMLSPVTAKVSWGFELKVTNATNIDIYPTVTSGKSKERFGVVVIGGSATVGFSPFKIGDQIQISWEEGESYDLTTVTIDSSSLDKLRKDIISVHLIYNGKGMWVLKAFDKNKKQIGSVP